MNPQSMLASQGIRRLLVVTALAVAFTPCTAMGQSRSRDLPPPDSTRAPLIVSVPQESAYAQAKQFALQQLLQALQTGDEALLEFEYSALDQVGSMGPVRCSSLREAISRLRVVNQRAPGRLPRGEHVPVYFVMTLASDAMSSRALIEVVVVGTGGRSQRTAVSLDFDQISGRWVGAQGLVEAICP